MSTAYSRPTFLQGILRYLEDANVTLTELVCFVLVSRQVNDISRPIYRDLLLNTKTILSALYYHPGTSSDTIAWAHDAMCRLYSDAVSDLAHFDEQWQFVAAQARPEQIRDFRVEEMAAVMEKRAPILWALVGSLLGAANAGESKSPSSATGDASQSQSARTDADSDSGVDSDDEYWEDNADDGLESADGAKEAAGASSAKSSNRKRARRGRGVSQTVVNRIKTVVILSMLLQNRNQKCNALQSIVGVFLHACNTPEKVVKVFSRMGVSVSLTSIHRAVRSLSEQTDRDIQVLGRSLLASFGYDNFELKLPMCIPTIDKPAEGLLHLTSGVLIRLEHGVTLDDLRCSRVLWERSTLNIRAPDPRPFDPYKTMEFLYNLHPQTYPATPEQSLSRRGRFRAWVVQRMLFEHGPASFKALSGRLKEPESVDTIPLVKTHYVPLRTMDFNQSKVSENIGAILDMFSQAGIGETKVGNVDMSEFVTLVHGDLGTYERVLSAQRRRSVENNPYDRLQSVVFVIGLFHFKMAAADAIWRLLVAPDKARIDETSFMRLVGRLRPQESSRLVANAKFRQQHELIQHVLTVLVLDAWRAEIKKRNPRVSSLDEWAASKPELSEIEAIAESIVQDYIEGAGLDLFELEGRPARERDQVQENAMRSMHYLLLYEELCYALNAGDIGRFETIIPHWVKIFRATGKHKYGVHTLRFMHALYFVYPERLRRAIRYNMLVNLTGKANEFRPVDWLVELLNLYTKVIYGGEGSNYTKARIILESVLVTIFRSSHANLERNFHLSGLTKKHATKDMKATFKLLLDHLKTISPNEYVAGRRSAYPIPNAFIRGAAIIAAESGRTANGQDDSDVATRDPDSAMEEGVEAEEELLDVELSAEDLSVEGVI